MDHLSHNLPNNTQNRSVTLSAILPSIKTDAVGWKIKLMFLCIVQLTLQTQAPHSSIHSCLYTLLQKTLPGCSLTSLMNNSLDMWSARHEKQQEKKVKMGSAFNFTLLCVLLSPHCESALFACNQYKCLPVEFNYK